MQQDMNNKDGITIGQQKVKNLIHFSLCHKKDFKLSRKNNKKG